mmetsp:Transcript_19520/g.65547  ORF Transcript_19520/g.65547 Transcript_19520/m.65547 type:complete len:207 (-) Transcript_19520:1001-1621(-)
MGLVPIGLGHCWDFAKLFIASTAAASLCACRTYTRNFLSWNTLGSMVEMRCCSRGSAVTESSVSKNLVLLTGSRDFIEKLISLLSTMMSSTCSPLPGGACCTIFASDTPSQLACFASGTLASPANLYRSRRRRRWTMALASASSGAVPHSICLSTVSSSCLKRAGSHMSSSKWKWASAATRASTTMNSIALALAWVYTSWCMLTRV